MELESIASDESGESEDEEFKEWNVDYVDEFI
jgi:hypothetical protein